MPLLLRCKSLCLAAVILACFPRSNFAFARLPHAYLLLMFLFLLARLLPSKLFSSEFLTEAILPRLLFGLFDLFLPLHLFPHLLSLLPFLLCR